MSSFKARLSPYDPWGKDIWFLGACHFWCLSLEFQQAACHWFFISAPPLLPSQSALTEAENVSIHYMDLLFFPLPISGIFFYNGHPIKQVDILGTVIGVRERDAFYSYGGKNNCVWHWVYVKGIPLNWMLNSKQPQPFRAAGDSHRPQTLSSIGSPLEPPTRTKCKMRQRVGMILMNTVKWQMLGS